MTSELKYTLGSVLFILLLAATYGLRLAVKGRVHFDRVERQGGSRFLSKRAMEFGYWSLEPVARLLVLMRVSPNTVSWASLGFGFLAGSCLAMGHFGFGAILATVSGLLDSLDGMVARLSGVASEAGEVLDAAVDRYVDFLFLSGLLIYYRHIPGLQILTLLALLGSFMVSYSTTKAEALKVDAPKGSMRRPERAVYLILGAGLSAVTIPWLETAQLEFSIRVGYPMVVALGLVAVAGNLSAIERFWSIAKAVRAREKVLAEARKKAAENVVIEERGGSQSSHRAADIRV
jgi:CDP-diacylglycerol--glycerol-3-phosphate 3-phosphatidyltransferase